MLLNQTMISNFPVFYIKMFSREYYFRNFAWVTKNVSFRHFVYFHDRINGHLGKHQMIPPALGGREGNVSLLLTKTDSCSS